MIKAVVTCLAFAAVAIASPASAESKPLQPVVALKAKLEAAVLAHVLPGARVIIAKNGRRLADIRVGWLDVERHVPLPDDAIFRLYSMSKPITSVAIMTLVERGKLRLNDPVANYLPELRDLRVYVSGDLDHMVTEPINRPITIADLLTHTSGIAYHFTGTSPVHQFYRKFGVMRDTPVGRMPGDGPPAKNLDELVARIGKAPLLVQPGTSFNYSYSTTVLGAVIERVSGKRLDRFLDQTIFRPLGMRQTGFFIDDAALPRFTVLYQSGTSGITPNERPSSSDYRSRDRLLDGGGALASTADDYLRFAQMLANGGSLGGVRILSPASVDAMFAPRVTMGGLGQPAMMFGYGFSIGDAASESAGIQPAGTASWSGSANTYFYVDRKRHAVALLMTHVLGSAGTARADVNRAAMQLVGD